MKKGRFARHAATGIIFVVAFSALTWAAEMAPESITRVTVWHPKAGMSGKLEEGVKKHNDWHRKQNDSWTLSTWSIESGPDTGAYMRITTERQWADFDAEEKWAEADDADSSVTMAPYIDHSTTSFYAYMPAISRPMKGDATPKMAEVIFFHLNQGHYEQFMSQVQKVHEAIGKTNWPVSYEWHALVSGGESPTFVLVLMKNSWADMKEPEMSFPAMLEKAYGKQEAGAIMKGFGESVHCETSQLAMYQADLSYAPAMKK